ncbi:hypothetical protein [Methanobrevibacter sp.]|uniref:hypothetical protein n=1 Tax=Methanobrevibacter sp. TaxID=66852 RepID=UPI00386D2DDB
MLRNNGKMIIGRNFLFCLCVICLMFTAFGVAVEDSFAVDLNETDGEIGLESNDINELENSQENNVLEVDSQDFENELGAVHTPSGDSYSNIQEKVNAARDGDTILLKGNYHSNGNDRIVIDKKLTITADNMATLDGKHLSTAFFVKENGAGTVFRNLKFINGEGNIGSAVIIHSKNVHIENCIFEDNHANHGGAVNGRYDLDIASGVIVDNCQFRRNTCYYQDLEQQSSAAALALYSRDTEVRNCIFEDNWVKSKIESYGGAIQVGLDEPGSNAKVINCIFKNNSAISTERSSHGGAGCVRDGTVYTKCIFIDNLADEGGALTFHASGEINNCTFIDNSANIYGGALSTGWMYDYMELTVNNCNFDGNEAPNGGAIQANGLNIIIQDSNFKNNKVTENGGAIYVRAEDVSIKNSIFNSNNANVDGGAVYIEGKNTLIEDSSFTANEAIPDVTKTNDGLGGAIYVDSSQALIKNNSFKFNTARNGSAIYYDESGEKLTLENNELFQNQAWVYQLPIYAEDIYYGDCEQVKVVLFGGNNIADFDNLAVSNAIYNAADNVNIVIDGEYPLYGATNTGELYQDGREYNINVLLSIQHEDGTVVYNESGRTNYLGEIVVDLENLKPGRYYVSAKHFEDTYYKPISNATTFLVSPKVDNEVRKSVSKSVANFEDVVTWTITITNHGPNDSTDVKLTDVLPEGLILINTTANGRYDRETGVLTVGNLKVNETFTFKMITVINKTGNIVNKVNVTAYEFDTDIENNHDEINLFVSPASDLAVDKSVSNSTPNYKDQITWTIQISNNGPDTAHDVVMFDVLPKSLIYVDCDGDYSSSSGIWNVGTLQKGQKATLNIRCIVNGTGLIENFASVNSSEFDYDETNNNDSERILVNPSSDLAIVKTVNASNVNYNDLVKWILTISNNGPDIAKNVRVEDLLPEGFSYVDSVLSKGIYSDDLFGIESIEVGETVTIEIVTLVENTGKFINYANVTSDNHDPDLTNNEDEEGIFVNPASDLSVTKSVSDSNPKFNDIVTWTVEVVNNGPDVAHNVIISDLLPDSLIWIGDDSLGDYNPITGILFIDELDVEESFELNIECRVNATGLIQNNVSVNASEYDYNLTNNVDNETIDVEKAADVSVIKSVDNHSPNYKDMVRWSLVISNKGPGKATDVYVEDRLPEGLILINYTATKGIYDNGVWVMCCLENGESETLEIICRVNRTGKIMNLATIHANEYDCDESNNADNESIDVPLAVDLQVLMEVNNNNPQFGEEVIWKISVKNNGPDNATGVTLDDILPRGLVFTGYESSTGIYEDGIWDIGSLNVDDVVYLNITTISDELGEITNDAKVNSREYDWNMDNNYADDFIDVMPIADVSIEKFVDNDYPKYGETVKWKLVVSNNGPNVAHNLVVRDILPKGLQFIKSNADYSNNSWRIGSLDVAEIKSIEIICRVISTGNFNNRAEVWADELDLDESNNHAHRSIHVNPASDLSITKSVSKKHYRVGDVIEYVIEVFNNGPDTAQNVKVSEILDDLLKLKSFKVTQGKFNKFTNVWTINRLGNGQSAKLVIKVVAIGEGIIKNTVRVTSDTFDYDNSNNMDSAIVNVTEEPSHNQDNPNLQDDSNEVLQSNLEIHPTANPIVMLMLCLIFPLIFWGNGISKKN